MKLTHGDPCSHRHNERRAMIVRRHREMLERERQRLEDEDLKAETERL